LRAKARYDRRDEEFILVRSEMTCVVLYYQHQEKLWRRWAEESGEYQGRRAYAHKQRIVWETFADEAEALFGDRMLSG